MTLTIDLTPQEEAWIQTEAQTTGVLPVDVVRRAISEFATKTHSTITVSAKKAGAIALLRSWIDEGKTDDPERIRLANEEVAELKRNLNANRAATGERLVFP